VDFGTQPAVGTSKVSVVRTTGPTATLGDLASAISRAGGPATAQVIDLGAGAGTDPPARLILTAGQTGSSGALTVDLSGFTGLDDTMLSDLRPAGDAKIHLGSLTAIRSTNTITDLLPGVTLNLAKAAPGTDVTVTVASDTTAVVSKVKALVDALNGVRSTMAKYTSYDAAKKVGGVLLSDGDARSLSSGLASATGRLLPAGSSFRTLSQLGVSLQRDGTYQLDETKLRAAADSDPAAVASSLSALAQPIAAWAKNSDGVTGTAYRAKTAADAQSVSYGKQIDNFQLILDQREARYRTQFSNLERALGQMKDQSNWLAGQIASLPQG
jgi:flagellar hook-associated protein 2